MMMMCGGIGAVNSATEDIQQMIDDLRMQIHEKAGQEYSQLKAISYKYQSLPGGNYFIKVRIMTDTYIHVHILDNVVRNVALNKLAEDREEDIN